MTVYTVTKPIGTTDAEFELYTRLLEDAGIDVSNAPRVREQGTDRKWLYAWEERNEAEQFAYELMRRSGDIGWGVYSFEARSESLGPVAPLDIRRAPELDKGSLGYTYYLTPLSRERIARAFPGVGLPPNLSFPIGVEQEFRRQQGEEGWMEVARKLTGKTDEEIDSLGGVRISLGGGPPIFQRLQLATGPDG